MERTYISVDEAATMLSKGLGKPVDRETIAQAFEFAPFSKAPFTLFVRVDGITTEVVEPFEVVEEELIDDHDGSSEFYYRLICPWPDPAVPGSTWRDDPQFDDCGIFVTSLPKLRKSPSDPVPLGLMGYFAIVQSEADVIRARTEALMGILPTQVYRLNRLAAPLVFEWAAGGRTDCELLFSSAEIEAYIAQHSRPLAVPDTEGLPEELRLALAAFRAVRADPERYVGKPPKRVIEEWLRKNTNLSNDALERVATVANWNKKGGAPRSPTTRKNRPPG